MGYKLQDLIDMEHFQNLQDRLNGIYSFPSSIIDNEGNILTATAWQDICTLFHRKNKECERDCIKSDQYILSHLHEANPAVSYRCPHGLVDNATPIIIEGVHYGNFFTGQFFMEKPDMEFFRAQAKKYGFDEDAYLEAVKKVPIWTKEQLNNYLYFIKGLIEVISDSGLKKLKEIETRQQIKESEERYRSLIGNMVNAFADHRIIVDEEGNPTDFIYLEINDAYEHIIGVTREQVIGKRESEITPKSWEEDFDWLGVYGRVALSGEPARFEAFSEALGKWFAVSAYSHTPGYFVTNFFDISDRKQAEEALKKERDLLQQITGTSPVGITYVDRNGQIVFANQRAEQILGLTRNTINQRAYNDPAWHITTDDGLPFPESELPFHHVMMSGQPVFDVKHAIEWPDGRRVFLSINAAPLFDAEGRADGMVASLEDITEHKRAEERLKESEERFRLAFMTSPDSVNINRLSDGIYIDINHGFTEIMGYTREDCIGKSSLHLDIWDDPKDRARLVAGLKENGYVRNLEARFRTKDGTFRFGLMSARVLTLNGEPCILSVTRDITERKRAEEALRASEERHRTILQTALDGFWITDMQGRLLEVNESYCRMSGYTTQELLAMNISDIEYAETHEDTINHNQPLVAQGKDRFETRHRRKDGSIIDVEVSAQYRPSEGGRIVAFLRDITEEKRIELIKMAKDGVREKVWVMKTFDDIKEVAFAIRNVIEKFVPNFHAFGLNIIDLSADPPIVTVYEIAHNDSILSFKSRVAGEQTILDIWRKGKTAYRKNLCEEDIFKESDHIDRNFKSRIMSVIDVPFSHGTLAINSEENDAFAQHDIELLENMAQILSEGFKRGEDLKQLENYIGKLEIDIAERKRAEKALRESEEKFAQLVEQSPISIEVYNSDGLLVNVNRAYEKLWSISKDTVIGKYNILLHQHVKTLNILDPVQKAFRGERVELPLLEHDPNITADFPTSRKRFIQPYIYPIIDEQGVVSHVVLINIDVTSQKQLESQLQQAQKMESVGRLAGGVAHDFNNMLAVILMNAEYVLMSLDPSNQLHASMEEIQKAGERSADLTRQLLAFARKQATAPKVIDLNETIEGMLKMLHRLIGEDITLLWIPGRNLRQVKIDPSQIDQILANLCVNARDAISDIGKVTIETANVVCDEAFCTYHPGFAPGEYVILSVSDNGCGMDRETLANIFEPFFTTKEVGKGTGLGLATVYGIVKQNNGFVAVESTPGEGTTLTIYLPQNVDKTAQVAVEELSDAFTGGKETILLVEDEPAILKMGKTILEELGYTVLAAGMPGEAIRIAVEYGGQIHLLMTDVVMPEMNGRDLAKRLLSLYPDIKRLFFSGYTADVIAHHGVLDEGVHFIQKPFTIQALTAKVREVLDKA